VAGLGECKRRFEVIHAQEVHGGARHISGALKLQICHITQSMFPKVQLLTPTSPRRLGEMGRMLFRKR